MIWTVGPTLKIRRGGTDRLYEGRRRRCTEMIRTVGPTLKIRRGGTDRLYEGRRRRCTEMIRTVGPTLKMGGSNSVARVTAFQAVGRGFESRLPLLLEKATTRTKSERRR